MSGGHNHETEKAISQTVQGLRRPRCRETIRTSLERVRQNLETQGRRQTIHTQVDSSTSVMLL